MAKKSSETPAKVAAKKSTVKKSADAPAAAPAVKKTAVKKVAVKTTVAKKAAAKKAPAAKSTPPPAITTIVAKVDIGFGNSLYVRGSGAGLSWEKGVLMGNASADEWVWSSDSVKGSLEFKVLINDETWANGDDCAVDAGDRVVVEPTF